MSKLYIARRSESTYAEKSCYSVGMRLLSPKAALILSAFVNAPTVPRYGYELMRETGIKSGSLYPILGRFESLGWIQGRVEPTESGRPPRRVYELDVGVLREVQAALDRYLEAKSVPADQRLNWGLA